VICNSFVLPSVFKKNRSLTVNPQGWQQTLPIKLSTLSGIQRFRSITRLSNENFSYAIEELPDDRILGDYDPDKSEFHLDDRYMTQGVGNYTPTRPHGYTFPPLKKPQQPEAVRPKEDALVVAKVVLSKFPKEKVDAYKES